jgi:hypothetical protein
MGENLSITCHWTAQQANAVNSPEQARSRRYPRRSAGNETINGFTHNFSPSGQGTLYPVKLFGIISLFERCRELSTAACPLYDECGDTIAHS